MNPPRDDERRCETRMRQIAACVGEGLYVTDAAGKVSFLNPEAERLLGWTAEEVVGLAFHDRIHRVDRAGRPLPLDRCPIVNVVKTGVRYASSSEAFTRKDGAILPVSVVATPLSENGTIVATVTAFRDMTDALKAEKEREALIFELQEALTTIKALHGILPICSFCRKIRDDKGSWRPLEAYLRENTDARCSHGLCDDCAKAEYPEFAHLFGKKETGGGPAGQ